MIVVFEAIDTAGKSTIINGLVKRCPERFVAVRDVGVDELVKDSKVFEPYGIDTKNPDTLQLLYCAIILGTEAELARHVAKGMTPLVDRYTDTLMVYADLFTDYRRPVAMHKKIAELIGGSCNPQPDLTFYLDIDYEEVIVRLRQRKDIGMLERFSPDKFQAIKEGFFAQMARTGRRYAVVPKGMNIAQTQDWCLGTINAFEKGSS